MSFLFPDKASGGFNKTVPDTINNYTDGKLLSSGCKTSLQDLLTFSLVLSHYTCIL